MGGSNQLLISFLAQVPWGGAERGLAVLDAIYEYEPVFRLYMLLAYLIWLLYWGTAVSVVISHLVVILMFLLLFCIPLSIPSVSAATSQLAVSAALSYPVVPLLLLLNLV